MTMTMTTNFKNVAIQDVLEKSIVKHLDQLFGRANILVVTCRLFLKSLMHLLRKELQLKDNCPFDNYKINDKYLQVKFLKKMRCNGLNKNN